MKNIASSLEPTIDSASKFLGAFTKLSIGLGCLIYIFYLLKTGHFPRGLTLGDGLMFLIVAGCFGAVYAFFVASMISLGYFITNTISSGISVICRLRPALSSIFSLPLKFPKPPKTQIRLIKFNITFIPFAIFGLFFTILIAREQKIIYLNLTLISAIMYILYSMAHYAATRFWAPTIQLETQTKARITDIRSWRKQIFFMCIGLLLLLPLIASEGTGLLLDASMRLAQIRVERAVLHVKAPYNQLLPKTLLMEDASTAKDFTAYKNVTILFHGVGDATVVSFEDGDFVKQISLPSDHVIVERRQKTQRRG